MVDMKPSLSTVVEDTILSRIAGRTYAAGEPINTRELEVFLGVSTIPIREALIRLADRGLLKHLPGRGYFALPFDRSEIVAAIDVVSFVETRVIDSVDIQSEGGNPLLPGSKVRTSPKCLDVRTSLYSFVKRVQSSPTEIKDIHSVLIKLETSVILRRFARNMLSVATTGIVTVLPTHNARDKAQALSAALTQLLDRSSSTAIRAYLAEELVPIWDFHADASQPV
jgi:Bacterial regulatory proteins, gntR family